MPYLPCCVQTHCYDAWLGGDARNTLFLKDSQRLGTLPAPLFLFLAGISFALVTGKLVRKNLRPGEVTRTMARRGAEIFIFGLLFRLQEYLIAWGWAPWSDLFRVDVLNIIGLSMILMALLCGLILSVSSSKYSSCNDAGISSKGVASPPVAILVGASFGHGLDRSAHSPSLHYLATNLASLAA